MLNRGMYMAFCNNCGNELSNNEKFCPYCGKPIENKATDNKKQTREERMQRIKCPNCGDLIDAFAIRCPSCDFELREIEANGRVENLAEQINELLSKGTKSSGLQIAELIRNFPIPNTVDDIVELMILASANIDPYAFSEYSEVSDVDRKISKAWESKMQQAYNKAALTFPSDEKFTEIKRIYRETTEEIRTYNNESRKDNKRKDNAFMRQWLLMAIPIFGLAIVLVISLSIRDVKMMNNGGVRTSYSADDLKGMNYEKVVEIMENDGFTNIVVKEDDGGFFNSQDEGEVIKITIDGSFFSADSVEKSDSKVLIIYKE